MTNTIISLQSKVAHPTREVTPAECAHPCVQEYEWVSLPDTALCKYLGLHYIALNEIVENSAEEGKAKIGSALRDALLSLWEIMFPDRGRETYRKLEGDDMTPITTYKSSNRYIVADGNSSLATARYLGQTYVLAQVWELP